MTTITAKLAARLKKRADAANERANEHTGLDREWYLGRRDAFEDVITMLNAEAEWLPIESAPKDGTRVLGTVGDAGQQVVVEMEYKPKLMEWHRPMQCGVVVKPTHWQPLPAPPSALGEWVKYDDVVALIAAHDDPDDRPAPTGDHAPEPWQVVLHSTTGQPLYIWDANENELCEMNRGDDTARRIVACVNACAGIPTAELEGAHQFEERGGSENYAMEAIRSGERTYTVTWKVEIDATSPEAAAELARITMDDHTRDSDIFEVEAIEDTDGEPATAVVIVRNGVAERGRLK